MGLCDGSSSEEITDLKILFTMTYVRIGESKITSKGKDNFMILQKKRKTKPNSMTGRIFGLGKGV